MTKKSINNKPNRKTNTKTSKKKITKKSLSTDSIKNKKKRGRPTSYNAKFHPKWVQSLAEVGKIDIEIAKIIGISEVTFYEWKKKYPEFTKALKTGKEDKDAQVEHALFKSAVGYEHKEDKIFCNADGKVTVVPTIKHYQPNPVSIKFYLVNRKYKEWNKEGRLDIGVEENTAEVLKEIFMDVKNTKVKLGKDDKVIEVDGKNVENEDE